MPSNSASRGSIASTSRRTSLEVSTSRSEARSAASRAARALRGVHERDGAHRAATEQRLADCPAAKAARWRRSGVRCRPRASASPRASREDRAARSARSPRRPSPRRGTHRVGGIAQRASDACRVVAHMACRARRAPPPAGRAHRAAVAAREARPASDAATYSAESAGPGSPAGSLSRRARRA
jgi:hypothetical protein